MKKVTYIISSLLKSLLILWVPVLLFEETFLYDYIWTEFAFIISTFAIIFCLIMYKKSYKKLNKEKMNCYLFNIVNTILLVISNLILGYLFLRLTDLKIFHHCVGTGRECFLFGIEYLIIGMEYAFFSVIILVIWLFVRLIKFLRSNNN